MPQIAFTHALKRFFPTLSKKSVSAGTVREALNALESEYPGLKTYLLTEQGVGYRMAECETYPLAPLEEEG